jgi:uncharacterized cofD-like protein
VVLVMNLMTQPGETDGMDASDHLAAIERHGGEGLVDIVLIHAGGLPAERLAPYREEGAVPVSAAAAQAALAARAELVERDLLEDEGLIRHDPAKLERTILEILDRGGEAPRSERSSRS